MDKVDRRVSGFLENGFGIAMVAFTAWLLTGDPAQDQTAVVARMFVEGAFRIGLLMMIIQSFLEATGRENILLRQDWQKFGTIISGVAMIACGLAITTSLIPVIFES